MPIDMSRSGEVTILQVRGARDLHDAVQDVIRAGGKALALDMGAVDEINDEDLRDFYRSLKACRRAGGDLCLARPSDDLRQALADSRLDEILRVYPTLSLAIASF